MMKTKTVSLIKILFVLTLISFLFGCAGKKKELKTVQGDPETLYKQALVLFNKKMYKDAKEKFEQIKSNFPDSPPYTLWAELKVADSHFLLKEYVEAAAAYEEFRKVHPTYEEIAYVQYQIGMSYFNRMTTSDRDQSLTLKALSNFENLVANAPPSLFTEKAKDKIGLCRKQLGEHEFYIGEFYLRQGKYQAAVTRFEGLLEKFPKWPEEDKTLLYMGKGYFGLGEPDKAVMRLTRLIETYPKSPYVKEAKQLLAKGGKDKKGASPKKVAGKKEKRAVPPPEEGPVVARYDEEGKKAVSLTEERSPGIKKEESIPLLPVTGEEVKPISARDGMEERREKTGALAPAEIPKKEKAPASVIEKEKTAPAVVAETPKPIRGREEPKENRMEPSPAREEIKAALIPGEEPPKSLSPQPRVEKGTEGGMEREKAKASLPGLLAHSGEREKTRRKVPPAPPAEGKSVDEAYPIDITSDSVETFAKDNLILFKGNVLARQKDVVIYADSVQAFVIEDGKGIERVVAGGNVKIQQGLRVASCQKAVFYNLDKKVVLTGEPRLLEGDNIVTGDEIIFDIERNKVEVKGGASGRGKARIIPQEEPKKKE